VNAFSFSKSEFKFHFRKNISKVIGRRRTGDLIALEKTEREVISTGDFGKRGKWKHAKNPIKLFYNFCIFALFEKVKKLKIFSGTGKIRNEQEIANPFYFPSVFAKIISKIIFRKNNF